MSSSSGSQTRNGKAFEYALAKAFEKITRATFTENEACLRAKACFESQNENRQSLFERAGAEMAMFLQAHDPNILTSKHIFLQEDAAGIFGDVRDIIIDVQTGEIGISAKVNHAAVKHSRLSANLDFGQKWTAYPCSKLYFDSIESAFSYLTKLKSEGKTFNQIERKDDIIYLPILAAFQDELDRLFKEHGSVFVENLFKYLLGRYDFYKVELQIKQKEVSVQCVNLYGALGYGKRWRIPDRIESISRVSGSKNTLLVQFNNGWQISFRLHSASGKVESSLKFDINLIASPTYVEKHSIPLK
ncbi:MAG: HaeIII family restriction endonuclease [Treponema sp.]|jgi:hypothetical protein|nr:HaeIII family restriction endonuclease [Treponema sp.]